ncbi:MAG TPA: carboxypeptidase-like regulatory domain-containing protein, partial [Pyrinomonadaceae bacterium]|nr:carboxypeptidase-like regulatory domain-containing protein [Pyrinomonadaceae bacterium]
MRRVAALVFIFLTAFTLANAQSTNASLAGRVSDPVNALIAGAKVAAISSGTNIRYEDLTNDSGEYQLTSLPPASYHLEIQRSGFKTLIKRDVVLHVQDAIRIDLQMTIGDVSETVTVESGAPLVNSESGTVSTVIN